MATVLSSGTVEVKTLGNEWGVEFVPVPGMKSGDEVLLTSYISRGGSGPNGRGPLYCPFISEKKNDGFEVLVYDIQANKFNVTITVDWAVVRN
jgi:hypothetical protein